MRKQILLWLFAMMLSFPVTVVAEGETNHGSHGGGHGSDHAPTQQAPVEQLPLQPEAPSHEMPGMSNEEHQNMQHAPTTEGHSTSDGDYSGVGSESPATTDELMEGGHGHGGPVVETPPNWGVLGAFGAINLFFILIGIWNKWIVRKAGA